MGIRIIGSGSFLPDQKVRNEEILSFLGPPRKPSGELIDSDWLQKKFGIVERRFDFDFLMGSKRSREAGGIFDTDMAVAATRLALADAGLAADQVDGLIHVSCTPDRDPRCLQNMIELSSKLGLRSNADKDYQNLGCAGLAKGLRNAQASIGSGLAQVIVVVASNTTSAQLVREHYLQRPGFEWAWLSPAVFADGAAALVLANDDKSERGLLAVACETDTSVELVRFPGGGGLNVTCPDNARDHAYVMDAGAVSRAFPIYMEKNLNLMSRHQLTRGQTIHDFDRVYIHQANGPLVSAFCQSLGIAAEKVPINIDRYGNTSSASTLLLLDEDRHSGAVKPGDKVLFLWIGAGVGVMHGFAAFQL